MADDAPNLPAERKPAPPPVQAGGQVAALVPQTLDEAFRVANAIAISGLAPKGMNEPAQVLVAIMAGAELGLAPFQAVQSFAVINGRPSLWGDGLLAVVLARGVKVKEWLEGEEIAWTAWCEVTRPDNGEVTKRSFSVADAKRAGLYGKQGPWQTAPKRMLQMRARAFALRDGCADMLRGIQVREEVEDYAPMRNVTPQPSGLAARLAAGKATAQEGFNAVQAGENTPPHNPETGEVEEPAQDASFVDHAQEIAEGFDAQKDAAYSDDEPSDADPSNSVSQGGEPDSVTDQYESGSHLSGDPVDDLPDSEGGKGPPPAVSWAEQVSKLIDEGVYKTVAELDTFTNDPDASRYFTELTEVDPERAKQLNAKIKAKRKALASLGRNQ